MLKVGNGKTRAEKSKILIRWKRLKGGKRPKRRKGRENAGKGGFELELDFWQKKVPHKWRCPKS